MAQIVTHYAVLTASQQSGHWRLWGRIDTCVYTAEYFPCSPETVTTLLIGYTPIQNVFGVKKNSHNTTLKAIFHLLFHSILN